MAVEDETVIGFVGTALAAKPWGTSYEIKTMIVEEGRRGEGHRHSTFEVRRGSRRRGRRRRIEGRRPPPERGGQALLRGGRILAHLGSPRETGPNELDPRSSISPRSPARWRDVTWTPEMRAEAAALERRPSSSPSMRPIRGRARAAPLRRRDRRLHPPRRVRPLLDGRGVDLPPDLSAFSWAEPGTYRAERDPRLRRRPRGRHRLDPPRRRRAIADAATRATG